MDSFVQKMLLLLACLVIVVDAGSRGLLRNAQEKDYVKPQRYLQESQNDIVGGSIADAGEYPWFAAFKPLFCGGTVQSGRISLTSWLIRTRVCPC
jgi:hypothetical protein